MVRRQKYDNYVGALLGAPSTNALKKIMDSEDINKSEAIRRALVFFCTEYVMNGNREENLEELLPAPVSGMPAFLRKLRGKDRE